MSTINQFQHGDVVLPRVELNWQLKEAYANKVRADRVTVAYGEVSGHSHQLQAVKWAPGVTCIEDAVPAFVNLFEYRGNQYIEVPEGTIGVLTHEEHNPITIDPGIYMNDRAQEQDPLQDRQYNVVD
jgi:hypothetical protein